MTDGWWGLSKRRRGRHAFPPMLFRVLRQCAVEAPQTGRHAEWEVITTLSQQGGGKRRGGTDASQLSLEQSGKKHKNMFKCVWTGLRAGCEGWRTRRPLVMLKVVKC